jgi:hypothetical protein
MTNNAGTNRKFSLAIWWALLMVALTVAIFIRIRLLDIPLERDEGEYAYAGQLMLQGVPPYKLAYNLKFPGTYVAYALIMSIFGQTISGVHAGLLVINISTVALIFFLGRRLVSSSTAIAAAAAYVVLSVGPSVLGTAAHATNFVNLAVLGGSLLLFDQQHQQSFKRLLLSGVLFGIGLLMKQPAFFFILFATLYLLVKDIQLRVTWKRMVSRQLTFWLGVVACMGSACVILWKAGVFDKFWFWTVDYARQYQSLVPLGQGASLFLQNVKEIIVAGWLIWVLAGFGLIAQFWNKKARVNAGFLLSFLIFSALALCPGFYFRQHYFILVLPAVALFAGVGTSTLAHMFANQPSAFRLIPFCLFAVSLIIPIACERTFLFSLSPPEASREIYSASPFPEAIKIANFVRERTDTNDTIAVLGSEPEIYFYAHRHSATGYIYTYGLMELQKYARQMQLEMIHEIEMARPKYLISIVVKDSWLEKPGSERLIFTWVDNYAAENYDVVGFINLVAHDHTDYYFGSTPRSVPKLGDYILIYERRSSEQTVIVPGT